MKIQNIGFNLIPNCKKFKLGGKYDNANAYKAMGFEDSVANLEIEIIIGKDTYILKKFLIVKGLFQIEVFDSKYTKRKCEEIDLNILEFQDKINKKKAKQKEIKLLAKLEHKDCIEIITNAYFETKTYLKKINNNNEQEVLEKKDNELPINSFNSIEEFYEFYSDDKTIKSFIQSLL